MNSKTFALLFALSVIISADLPASDILEAARQASIASGENLQSAKGSGTFTVHRRNLTEKSETLWTAGSFEFSYDLNRYYLDITFRKRLRRQQNIGEAAVKIVDSSPDRLIIVSDGLTASVVSFSERFRPTGCSIETFDSMNTAAAVAEFPISSPAKPWLEVLHVDALIKNLGADAITFSQLDNGVARGMFKVKNSKTSYCEFDIDPKKGHNVVASNVFVQPSREPVSTYQLTWNQMNSVWFVKQFESSRRYRPGGISPFREHTVITFDSFSPNKLIDEKLFAIESLPIPLGTRILDRTR